KVRGHRIEPGEIETALTTDPTVTQAVVIAHEDGLVAYVVPAADAGVDTASLRGRLRSRLPSHLVPSVFTVLDALPLTPNGKLDRAALPAPDPKTTTTTDRPPRTPRERVLCELFAETLGVPTVGIDDDFFALGGHSLLATRLTSRIRTVLDTDVNLRTLFEAPTVTGLAAHLDEAGQARPRLTPGDRPEKVPLSFAQQGLWFLHRLEGPGATYNIPLALRLSGVLDRTALNQALDDVMARHESLRTVFAETDDLPFQQIIGTSAARRPLPVTRVTEATLASRLADGARHAFDLVTERPLRAELFALDPTEHVLLIVIHHIAADGWSLEPLARDLATAYAARSRNQGPGWKPLPVQYADYTLWQHRLLGDRTDPDSLLNRQLSYWTGALAGLPDELALPHDRPRPAVASHHGARVDFELDEELHTALAELGRRSGASLFMVLHASLAALLTKLGAGSDITVGSPIAGRTDQALDHLVGYFVNTLVLRTDTSGDPT
ncbi:condensation domain-containing protein, partial [Embleya sp. NPDC001921]